jgi:polysaccharide biosynthesis transport protein
VHQTQLAITEIKRFLKRRKIILILAPLLLIGVSIAAALVLPPKYESSISILVEQDETLNPMIQYSMAVAMASEDRLSSFNEIIQSRSTMHKLIDSLDLDDDNMSSAERDDLVRDVRGDVRTTLRASDSFSISFMNDDPELAQKGVKLLSDHFIRTRLAHESRRNEQTVEFFENKLAELEEAVAVREEQMMAERQATSELTVRADRSIQSDIEGVESTIREISRNIERTQSSLEVLRSVNQGGSEVEKIREIDLAGLPSGSEMRENLNLYRDYSQRYTSQYPRVRQLQNRILDLTDRMIVEIEAELFEQHAEKSYLQDHRSELVQQLEQTTATEQQRSGTRSDYDVYKAMYDDMKVKVEQARSTRELGDRAQNQFIVIDEANIPEKPARPNRRLLVAGGLFIGLFLGVVGAGVAELLDTTVRRPEDLKRFKKPVVAFIPGGTH